MCVSRLALDWAALKDDEVAVDVGGGTGNLTLLLAKAFPHLKYVVQDLKEVIPEAEKVISDSVDFVPAATDLQRSPSYGQQNIQARSRTAALLSKVSSLCLICIIPRLLIYSNILSS